MAIRFSFLLQVLRTVVEKSGRKVPAVTIGRPHSVQPTQSPRKTATSFSTQISSGISVPIGQTGTPFVPCGVATNPCPQMYRNQIKTKPTVDSVMCGMYGG